MVFTALHWTTKNPLSLTTCGFLYFFASRWMLNWCRWPDLNRHDLRHHPLKMACLPISPHRHKHFKNFNYFFTASSLDLGSAMFCYLTVLISSALGTAVFSICAPLTGSAGCLVELASGTAGISSDLIAGVVPRLFAPSTSGRANVSC